MALRNLSPDRHSGGYTPTLTAGTNVDAVVLLNAFFAVHGDLVECWVAMTVDATTAAAYDLRISLPFGIPVAAAGDIIGTASPLIPDSGGSVTGDATNNEAQLDSAASTTGVETVVAHFAYRMT